MAEIEECLRAEDSGVYMTYCSQVWTEALNQARVEVSSVLRKVESVYYPLPSESLSLLARGLIPPPRWQRWARTVQPMFQLLLPNPSRRMSTLVSQEKKRTLTREWPLML